MTAQGNALVVLHIFGLVLVEWGAREDGFMDGPGVVKRIKDGL